MGIWFFIYSSGSTIECYAVHVTSHRQTAQFAYCQQFYIPKVGVSTEPHHFSVTVTGPPSPTCVLGPFGNIDWSILGNKQKVLWDRIYLGGSAVSRIQYTAVLTIRSVSHTVDHSDEWNKPAVEGTARWQYCVILQTQQLRSAVYKRAMLIVTTL
jgi:hypothetical protein